MKKSIRRHSIELLEARIAPATFLVRTTADVGPFSLRELIATANSTPGDDVIQFAATLTYPITIALSTPLPTITEGLTIEGITNTGFAGIPRVTLDGAGIVGAGDGLVAAANNVSFTALAVVNFPGYGIALGNRIGSVQQCMVAGNQADGIRVTGRDYIIGGSGVGNIITGNDGYGISLAGLAGQVNTVLGNLVGIAADGSVSANTEGGIFVGSGIAIIGGAGSGDGNLVSGNGGPGISIESPGALVKGNRVGLNLAGTAVAGNNGAGIFVAAANASIGGAGAGDGNIVVGNTGAGIFLSGAANALVAGNLIGTTATGASGFGNLNGGISSTSGSTALIGGNVAGTGNVISGNTGAGIAFNSGTASIFGNNIGRTPDGTGARPNTDDGIRLTGGAGHLVGGVGGRNVIASNSGDGVEIASAGATVQANYIGLNATGIGSAGNAGVGIRISGGGSVVIGGTAAQGNVISSNSAGGILSTATSAVGISGNLIGADANGLTGFGNNGIGAVLGGAGGTFSGNTVVGSGSLNFGVTVAGNWTLTGNFIGITAAGTTGTNSAGGISVTSGTVLIGGTTAAERNIIAGNTGPGIVASGGTLTVRGNFIGLAPDGTTQQSNGDDGIRITAGSGHVIASNVISGNSGDGIELAGAGATLTANLVGLTANGDISRANAGTGILISGSAPGTVIIGGALAEGNFISGNSAGGIVSTATIPVTISGNRIGTDFLGAPGLGNAGNGATLGGAGGVFSGNTIVSSNAGGFGAEVAGNWTLTGNFIGTNSSGVAGVNTGGGILVTAGTVLIGGAGAAERNVVAANNGPGISVVAGTVTVRGNFIGLAPDGTTQMGNSNDGIRITAGGGHVIASNIISGNGGEGIEFKGTTASITGNIIGLAANGLAAMGNTGTGILVSGSTTGVVIGGGAAGEGNVIASHSSNAGIVVDGATGLVIRGNTIGLAADGNTARGNATGIQLQGATTGALVKDNTISANIGAGIISISTGGAHIITGNRIGTDTSGTVKRANNAGINITSGDGTRIGGVGAEGNTIAGNSNTAILLSAANCIVKGNFIGTNATGASGLGNGGNGITVNGAGALIGGAIAGEGNVISANNTGITITASGATVRGNLIGLTPDGAAALGNADNGGIIITGTTANTLIRDNVISGNSNNGIRITTTTGGHQVLANKIGTNAAGTAAIANSGYGVRVENFGGTQIGGPGADGNLIAANTTGGIYVSAPNCPVKGNLVGTNSAGAAGLGNATGIYVQNVAGALIGGAATGEGNVISGNTADGIQLDNASDSVVRSNRIGATPDGSTSRGNGGSGLLVSGSSANALIRDNVISANGNNASNPAIDISGTAGGHQILGNRIGTDVTGTTLLANTGRGINIGGAGSVRIGGPAVGDGNVIAGGNGGILLSAPGCIVQGNIIGTNGAGVAGFGSSGTGIAVNAASALVGGAAAGEGNVVVSHGTGGISISAAGAVVRGNLVGLAADGTTPRGNTGVGIRINNPVGDALVRDNLVSGNTGIGIFQSSNVAGNQILGNKIGTNAGGTAPAPNGGDGIQIGGAGGSRIGGPAVGDGNLICASGANGIALFAPNCIVQGNLIGTNAAGASGLGNTARGIVVFSTGSIIGGGAAGEGNVIAGGNTGIRLEPFATGAVVRGNFIGTNAAGAAGLGSSGDGVFILAAGATIGGPGAGDGNVISGHAANGMNVLAANVVIQGNRIGTTPDGNSARANSGSGIMVQGSGVGGVKVLGNVVSGNGMRGIELGGTVGNHEVRGNFVGTNASGTALIPNVSEGIRTLASGVKIGGVNAGDANTVGGNLIGININGTSDTVVVGNFIGTNATGAAGLGNVGDGIFAGGSNILIGGSLPAERNIISGNGGDGVEMGNATVRGNIIGLAPDGITPLGNTGAGLRLSGGIPLVRDNVISANGGDGIACMAGNLGIKIFGNKIGTDTTGAVLRGNTGAGVLVTAGGISIGSATAGDGNVISGNANGGITISSGSGVVMKSNTLHANSGWGVRVSNGSQNQLGGTMPGEGNVITDTTGKGVIGGGGNGTRLRIEGNIITGSTGLSIDLADNGPTANDALDADTGPNTLLNTPVITGVAVGPDGATVNGSYSSAASTTFSIEFFKANALGALGSLLVRTNVTTDTAGNAPFSVNVGTLLPGEFISATATHAATFSTSEVASTAAIIPVLSVGSITLAEGAGGTLNAVFTATLDVASTQDVSFTYATADGTALSGKDYTATSGSGTIPAGSISVQILVPILGDAVPEPDELFTLGLASPVGAVFGTASATATITNDDTTLKISADKKTAIWRDLDGDFVTLKSTKAVLDAGDFIFLADGRGGEQLARLALGDDGLPARSTNLTFTAKLDSSAPVLGDGVVHVGFLDAIGLDLGKVSITGDLARIAAGDATLSTPALAALTAGSFGAFGITTQQAGGTLASIITGKLGALIVRGDFSGASLLVAGGKNGVLGPVSIIGSVGGAILTSEGAFTSLKVLGSLEGTTVHSGAKLGPVTIGGNLRDATLSALGTKAASTAAATAIAAITIGGNAQDSRILSGHNSAGAAQNPDAGIGVVKIAGRFERSIIAAGIATGPDTLFATADDILIAASVTFPDAAKVLARIAAITIGSSVLGSAATGDHFGITAQQIGSVKIGPTLYPLAKGANAIQLTATGDFTIRDLV